MRTFKSITITLLGMAAPIAVTIVSVPLFLAQIGQERYGALAIAWLVLGYVGQADFGMSRAITQRIASLGGAACDPKKAGKAIWSSFCLASGFGLLGGVVIYLGLGYFFSGPFQIDEALVSELEGTVLLLALSAPLVNYYSVAIGTLLGTERLHLVALLNSLSSIFLQMFPLVAAFVISVDLTTLVGAALIARLVITLPALAIVWFALLKAQPVRTSREEMGNLSRFGVWVMVTAIVGPLMVVSDRFLIGAVSGAVAVTAYTIPFQIANRTLMIPYAVMQVMFPRFAADTAADAHASARQYMVYLGTVYAVVVIFTVALAEPLLRLWLGAELDERSIIVAQIIMIGLWAVAIAQVPFGFLQARGNPRFTGLLHVIELPFYVAMLAILGEAFGLMGVALAFAVRCVGDFVALAYRARLLDAHAVLKLLPPMGLILATFAVVQLWTHPAAPYLVAVGLGGQSIIWAWFNLPISARQKLIGSFSRFLLMSSRPREL